MGIAGSLWRVEISVAPSISFSIPARKRAFCRDGSPSCAFLGSRRAAVSAVLVPGRSLDSAALKGRHEDQRRALEWADVCPQGMRTMTKPLVCMPQRASQFPLRPYNLIHEPGQGGYLDPGPPGPALG